ncbi:MAG: hypothetical protein JW736_10055 [Deltaproteobacteria bacterium]|nr:hypothetical protein [Deltaproteobacteria bacterium]
MKESSGHKKTDKVKIAVPLFGRRVSPHFGASSNIMLIDTIGTEIVHTATWDVGEQSATAITRCLKTLSVDIMICGGIQLTHKQWLTLQGIDVIDNQKGDAETLLAKILATGVLRRKKEGLKEDHSNIGVDTAPIRRLVNRTTN